MSEATSPAPAEMPEHGMECRECGVSVATDRDAVALPDGWGFVLRPGRCADGLPGLEPFYACPDCKEDQ